MFPSDGYFTVGIIYDEIEIILLKLFANVVQLSAEDHSPKPIIIGNKLIVGDENSKLLLLKIVKYLL